MFAKPNSQSCSTYSAFRLVFSVDGPLEEWYCQVIVANHLWLDCIDPRSGDLVMSDGCHAVNERYIVSCDVDKITEKSAVPTFIRKANVFLLPSDTRIQFMHNSLPLTAIHTLREKARSVLGKDS
jgi:hypothetical protein